MELDNLLRNLSNFVTEPYKSKMAWSTGQKLEFVLLLRDNKDILFGEFSPSVTKEVKNRKWEEIANQMRAHGAIFKDIKNLRKVNRVLYNEQNNCDLNKFR